MEDSFILDGGNVFIFQEFSYCQQYMCMTCMHDPLITCVKDASLSALTKYTDLTHAYMSQ